MGEWVPVPFTGPFLRAIGPQLGVAPMPSLAADNRWPIQGKPTDLALLSVSSAAQALADRHSRPVHGSLEAIGIDLTKHDLRLEDN